MDKKELLFELVQYNVFFYSSLDFKECSPNLFRDEL